MRFATTISLLSLIFSSSAATVPENYANSWGLVAKTSGTHERGRPVILGDSYANSGAMFLASGPNPAEDETLLRFELKYQEMHNFTTDSPINVTAARILDHPGIDVDIYMWQTFAAKILAFSIKQEITGKPGSWEFVKVGKDWLLGLNGDTKARAVYVQDKGYQVYFGSDIPASQVGTDIVLVGVKI